MTKYLSISEMAKIHNISRQTLIYYDRIGLFKPEHVDPNGYRLYSPFQIPFLREIIFLKSAGIKLEDIKSHIENRNLTTAISLLEYHKEYIDSEINKLMEARNYIVQRLNTYVNVSKYESKLYKPIIEEYGERKAIFLAFKNEVSRQELHLTLMEAWSTLSNHEMLPAEGFGTIIMKESLEKDYIFEGAGAFILLPLAEHNVENSIALPAGQYACMYKHGMPYDTQFLYNLIKWIKENGYKIAGNIVDACVLDNTFYGESSDGALTKLQIPVEKG